MSFDPEKVTRYGIAVVGGSDYRVKYVKEEDYDQLLVLYRRALWEFAGWFEESRYPISLEEAHERVSAGVSE